MSITINNKKTNKVEFISGEAKRLTFTFDVSILSAEFTFIITDLDNQEVVLKEDIDFDKANISIQQVMVTLTSTDLDLADGQYKAQLKTVWNEETSVDKTEVLKLYITESLFPEISG